MAVPQSAKSKRDQVFLLGLFVTLVVSFAGFTYFMLMPFSQFNTHSHGKKLYIAAELQELEKSSRIVEFSEHEDYKNLSREFDPLWDKLLTPNGGYLTADRKTNETDKLGISMFHQLHCLAMIREEMQYLVHIIEVLKENTHAPELHSQLQRRHKHGGDSMNPLNHDADHPLHCFDYLRQVRNFVLLLLRVPACFNAVAD